MSDCGYNYQRWNGSSLIGMDVNYYTGQSWITQPWKTTTNLTTLKKQIETTGTWTIGGMKVKSCQSEMINAAQCELQFVSYILYVVVACNLIKLICMIVTARYLWDLSEPILATVGDAVSSFLDQPDQTTTGLCLLDHQELNRGVWRKPGQAYKPTYGRKQTTRLYSATSHLRWWCTMIPLSLYVAAGFVLWQLSLLNLSSYTLKESMKMKFGAVDAGLILGLEGSSGSGLIIDVVVANSFQVVLSATYFLYNSLYTAQCAALEWSSYVGGARKALRVTWPRGQQRWTYYLHLPYRYGIPLTALLLAVHFLISQSIFLARLQYRDWQGSVIKDAGFADVGYSPRATLTTCLVGVIMVLVQIAHALRPLDNRIPIHGNNSAVISAMCHPQTNLNDTNPHQSYLSRQDEADNIAVQPLLWGVTIPPAESADASSQKGLGHCSFINDVVEPPELGRCYH